MDNRIYKELNDLSNNPIPGVSINLKDNQISHWTFILQGPAQTPYGGGHFHLEANLANNYPFKAPEIHFTTPIFHPNISKEGQICKQMIGLDHWAPYNNIRGLIDKIESLLLIPNPDDGTNPEAQLLYKESVEKFNHRAQEETHKFAK